MGELGKLAEPATALVNRCFDFLGVVWEPTQIKRIANARSKANLIKTKTDIEISDVQRRVLKRWIHEEEHRQINIENTIAGAVSELMPDAKPENLDSDWLTKFFEGCRAVSDEDMQKLWSKLLASEANRAGSLSIRTTAILAQMDRRDAEWFKNLCRFNWDLGSSPFPIVFNDAHSIYKNCGINYDQLRHLEAIGLITLAAPITGFSREVTAESEIVSYSNHFFLMKYLEHKRFSVGKTLFTVSGAELSRICEVIPVEGFVEYATEMWKSKNVLLEQIA